MRFPRRRVDARRQHDDGVFGHRFALDLADDAPVAHDDDAVADADQLRHLGRNDDDRPALRGERDDEAIDLLLGADVDAARRFVDDDELRIELQHLGDQQLLLVAARHLAGQDALVADADVEAANRLVERLPFLGAVDQRPALELLERRERQIGGHRLLEQQPFALAVLGQVDGAGVHGAARVRPALRPRRRGGCRRRPCAGRTAPRTTRCGRPRSGRKSRGSRPAAPRSSRLPRSPAR